MGLSVAIESLGAPATGYQAEPSHLAAQAACDRLGTDLPRSVMDKPTLLSTIESPDQVSGLNPAELRQLAQELRDEILRVVSEVGGHLGASLGVTELTVALHHCFDSPKDKLIWDVGHQAYGHKLLTGRRDQFDTIRQYDGISGFPRRTESPHDAFGVGHASTSISAALGFCKARDLRRERHHVVAVIGDGALSGGIAFEGMNNAGHLGSDLIVVLNDNEMSISPNVGAMSRYLTQITTGTVYTRMEAEIFRLIGKLPAGEKAQSLAGRIKEALKNFMVPGQLFESMGFRYFGPLDGHDIDLLVETFEHVKRMKGPILVHLITRKGKGYSFAEKDAAKYHGVASFDPKEGLKGSTDQSAPPSYTSIFGKSLTEMAKHDRRVVAITAAMPDGTGLSCFEASLPDRFFDVGIAEQHAVTFAAGLACRGMKPVCAIYSTFLQRAYDQVIHDVALQDLNVFFVLDRAGLVGADGATHHGVFDLSYLRAVPGMVIMSPKDENELRRMIATGLLYDAGPIALRFPRGKALGVPLDDPALPLPLGRGEVIQRGSEVLILAIGSMVAKAVEAADLLERKGISSTVVNARFVKPMDNNLFLELSLSHRMVVTLEEGALVGGFGSAVLECFHEHLEVVPQVLRLGIPDHFVEHGAPDLLHKEVGLDEESIAMKILAVLDRDNRRIDLAHHRREGQENR